MTTYADPLAEIDAELARAAAPKTSNKKPIFLFLKEGHKALIRPLADLRGCVILLKHNKFNADASLRVNAICAHEEDQECKYCADVASDKKLTPSKVFYLPVYVYSVVDQATQKPVTYKERDEAGNEVEKPVQGIRVLELSSFGTIGTVLKWFRDYMRDADEPGMTERDFVLSQVGQGQNKTFNVLPKTPKAMPERLAAVIPTQEQVRTRILEALPPQTLAGDSTPAPSPSPAPKGDVDEIPEF